MQQQQQLYNGPIYSTAPSLLCLAAANASYYQTNLYDMSGSKSFRRDNDMPP